MRIVRSTYLPVWEKNADRQSGKRWAEEAAKGTKLSKDYLLGWSIISGSIFD